MDTVYDVRKLLLRFGTVIYLGDCLADLELMEKEIFELYQMNLIIKEEYIKATLILSKEKQQ